MFPRWDGDLFETLIFLPAHSIWFPDSCCEHLMSITTNPGNVEPLTSEIARRYVLGASQVFTGHALGALSTMSRGGPEIISKLTCAVRLPVASYITAGSMF